MTTIERIARYGAVGVGAFGLMVTGGNVLFSVVAAGITYWSARAQGGQPVGARLGPAYAILEACAIVVILVLLGADWRLILGVVAIILLLKLTVRRFLKGP